MQRLADDGVVPAEREHPETGEHVEVFVTVGVVEVRALAAGVVLVEPDCVQHARQLWIEELAVQRVTLRPAARHDVSQVEPRRPDPSGTPVVRSALHPSAGRSFSVQPACRD